MAYNVLPRGLAINLCIRERVRDRMQVLSHLKCVRLVFVTLTKV